MVFEELLVSGDDGLIAARMLFQHLYHLCLVTFFRQAQCGIAIVVTYAAIRVLLDQQAYNFQSVSMRAVMPFSSVALTSAPRPMSRRTISV